MLQCPAITTVDAYKAAVTARLGLHIVEVINNEVISAATDNTGSTILLHCRVEPSGQLTFTAKTKQ